MISPASVDDAAGAVALLDVVHPDRLTTLAGLRYRMTVFPPGMRPRWWKADVDGRPVGWAGAGLSWWASEPGRAYCGVAVHPAHRNAGIGTALWEAAAAYLDDVGARSVLAYGRDDAASRRFAERCGFRLSTSARRLALDPRTLPPPEAPPPGVEIKPLSRCTGDLEELYRVDHGAMQDEPGGLDTSGMTFAMWRRDIWDAPDIDHDLGMVALVRARIAGSTWLTADRASRRAHASGTGVATHHRGRGLGLLLKHHSLAAAAAVGITLAIAENDEQNAAMLAINHRLGYRPIAVELEWLLEP